MYLFCIIVRNSIAKPVILFQITGCNKKRCYLGSNTCSYNNECMQLHQNNQEGADQRRDLDQNCSLGENSQPPQ